MRTPKKLSSEDLQHPKAEVKGWNGDKRKKGTRWNGDSDMEDTGFMSRGVHSVTPPINTETAPRALQQPPSSIAYERPYSHLTDGQKALYQQELKDNAPVVIELSKRQKKQTHRK